MRRTARLAALCLLGAVLLPPAHAEVVEEIVAFVNGGIITRSELEDEEKAVLAEAYRRFAGEELDRQVAAIKQGQLIQMIDRKILLSRVERVYDVDAMKESFYEQFKVQQGIETDEEVQRALEREGMTLDELKNRLLEMFAPDEAVRLEVGRRISVGEAEVRRYYDENPSAFIVPQEVELREIVLLAATPEERERRRSEAAAARARIVEGGESFADVATEVSEAGTADEGGALGKQKKGDLAGPLEKAAFELPVGAVSDVIEMPYGLHIVKVEDRTSDQPLPFEEVADRLRQELENQKYFTELELYRKKARSEAEWCVKAAYADRIPAAIDAPTCAGL